ncbi:MAG: YjbQ family protein [Deltaproteobacteria bacterium]|nr:YjbQ family protein [Deltaproteobacteria bacterium]
MVIFLRDYYVNTSAKPDILLITHDVKRALRESDVQNGVINILIPGATGGVTLLEADPKIHEEFRDWVLNQIPESPGKRPSRRSGAGKNSAHLQAAVVGPHLSLPVQDGRLMIGHWQEVILFDFDDRIGRREIRIQVIGEGAK